MDCYVQSSLRFAVANALLLAITERGYDVCSIKDKQYLEEFKQHGISSVLAIGLAFCGKEVALAHEVI